MINWPEGSFVFGASTNYLQDITWTSGSAVGNPKEKIRIEPVESPVPSKTPVEAPPVEQPEVKEPVGV